MLHGRGAGEAIEREDGEERRHRRRKRRRGTHLSNRGERAAGIRLSRLRQAHTKPVSMKK
jgi:hypothetical protein